MGSMNNYLTKVLKVYTKIYLWSFFVVRRVVADETCHLTNEAHAAKEVFANIDNAESVILRYLSTPSLSPRQEESKPNFHVQGWRWHTMSLVRDTRRLERLARRLLSSYDHGDKGAPSDAINTAAEHVINFNMKGLHRIENDVLFPWLRDHLLQAATGQKMVGGRDRFDVGDPPKEDDSNLGDALRVVLDTIDKERSSVCALGEAVREQARIASLPAVTTEKRTEALNNVARISATIYCRTRDIMEKEQSLLVPSVAALIPEREQKSLNNRVIRKLGILDSRLHLVGMHDAVIESNSPTEMDLFELYIPNLPRLMLPRWKRSLYEPKAGVLDLS